jgi:hypothetical protein
VKSITSGAYQYNQWITVPVYDSSGQVIKVFLDIKFTLWGRLRNLLFWGDILFIGYKLKNGNVLKDRLNILNANSDVSVSPYLNSFTSSEVTQIMFDTKAGHYFVPGFHAEWVTYPVELNKVFGSIASSSP